LSIKACGTEHPSQENSIGVEPVNYRERGREMGKGEEGGWFMLILIVKVVVRQRDSTPRMAPTS